MTKILLVEDNEMNQDMLTRRLLRRGYEIVCAIDGQMGVEMAHAQMPDLILMDMSLPIIDGWEATRRLKADAKTRSIPIIALTAHAMMGDRQKSLDAGCNDYDTKPVELARLLSKVETLLAKSAAGELTADDALGQNHHGVVREATVTIPQQTTPTPTLTPIAAIEPIAAAAISIVDEIETNRDLLGRQLERAGNTTILIVDDIETNRDMLGRRLERAGYTTILAEGGRQALEIIDRQPIDLVLLDIMMPDFNGIETLKAIRAKYSMAQLPVIMATAKDRSEDMLEAFDLGASDYVTKPIDLPVVLARIQTHLRLVRAALQEQPIPSQSIQSTPAVNIAPISVSTDQALLDLFEPATLEPTNQLLLGRYKISQQLGRDDFQDIYLAQDTQQAQQPTCIVRQIHLDLDRPSLNLAKMQQFKQEVEVFKQLSHHDNIASILEIVQQEQQLYLVQKYIGMTLLSHKIELERCMGTINAIMIIIEILKILQSFHQHQLIHQHLDANCFAYNLEEKLCLVELGVAARLSTNSPRTARTSLRTEELTTTSYDIYSVGQIILHVLTGVTTNLMPADPKTGEIKWQHLCVVGQSFAKIINKMICKNPSERYQDIETVLKDLYQLPMVSILLKNSQLIA